MVKPVLDPGWASLPVILPPADYYNVQAAKQLEDKKT